MFLKEALLLLAGLAAGSTVAAGVYAFLVVIGVYPRLIGKTATATKGKIFLYETIIALGGLFGNVVDLFTEKVKQLTGSFLRIAWPAAMPEAELWQKAAEGGGRTGAGAGFLVMFDHAVSMLHEVVEGPYRCLIEDLSIQDDKDLENEELEDIRIHPVAVAFQLTYFETRYDAESEEGLELEPEKTQAPSGLANADVSNLQRSDLETAAEAALGE